MNVQLSDKKRRKKIIATVSDIFDYVFNEGEYRLINRRERLDISIISLNRKSI
jgi:hypothetical protein